jgi:trans-2,3-dihydro-3-hydroxyanthranilate isomerase
VATPQLDVMKADRALVTVWAMPQKSLQYVLVDVFAREPFAGNQLAVVLGADDLSTRQMQAIAQEFNLAETTFPVRRTSEDEAAGADYRVRIFTASREIAFAGHPTLGTAWVLAQRERLEAGDRLQACGAGLIGVTVPDDLGDLFELRAEPRDLSAALSHYAAARCAESVGLRPDDVAGEAFAAGCGLSWVHLPVSASVIARARPRLTSMDDVDLGESVMRDLLIGLNVYALDGTAVRSRVFVPGPSVPEDPATGSAAVGLGIALVASGVAAGDGVTRYEIVQGVELGRPSYLSGRVSAEGGVAKTCWVAGQVQAIGEGTIAVPPV